MVSLDLSSAVYCGLLMNKTNKLNQQHVKSNFTLYSCISVHHDAMSMSTLQPDITGGGFQSLGPGMMPSGATGIGLGVSFLKNLS